MMMPIQRNTLLWGVAVLFINITMIGAYHALFAQWNYVKIGVVDMNQITVATRTNYLKVLLATKDVKISETEAEAYMNRTGEIINSAIRDIERDCKCVLMARGAAMSSDMVDYTDYIMKAIAKPG